MVLKSLRSGFSSTFWIANTLELFERLAFYGAKAVLVIFLLDVVKLEDAGTLAGDFSFIIYFLPIVAGVVVDRFGFKRSLSICFAIFASGYFLIGLAGFEFGDAITNAIGKHTYMVLALTYTAIGGSLIKPCIVGTVSKTSSSDKRALGFSIYYSLVNFGGMLGPLLAIPVRENLGIQYVLLVSSITSALLFLGTLIFFREPVGVEEDNKPAETRTFGTVFRNMLTVFGNIRFMMFLVIFSGFWIMFWQIFLLLPKYGTDVLSFDKFEILESIDAFCIILLTIPVTALVSKWKPIVAMTVGFLIASVSWIIMGASQTVEATFIAIAMFALGEAMQAPRFYEYVSKLAPKDQIGTFMGFAFLPVAIGALVAGRLADWLRVNYLETDPATMWYIVAGIGFVCTTFMILYNQFVAKKDNAA